MDLYIVLGLTDGANERDIKRAYRRLARRFHPDVNPGDREAEARFRQILDAYETLVDPDRRSRYDAGDGVATGPPAGSGFEGFDFSARGVDYSATFGDLFAEVLADRGARGPRPERGADLHQAIELSFDDTLEETERIVMVTRREACRACAGSGLTSPAPGPCLVCEGSGAQRSVRGHMVFSRRCSACGGSGQQRPRPCGECGGAGQETRTEAVHVRIPAGIADGDRVRVIGTGNGGMHGGQAGDLYVAVHVTPHPRFRREGEDLHIIVPIAIHEAALGARISVPTPDGPAPLRIPPGTQSGQRFRLRERGVRSPRGTVRGDLVIEMRLMLPRMLDERSKELLREFGRINGEHVRD